MARPSGLTNILCLNGSNIFKEASSQQKEYWWQKEKTWFHFGSLQRPSAPKDFSLQTKPKSHLWENLPNQLFLGFWATLKRNHNNTAYTSSYIWYIGLGGDTCKLYYFFVMNMNCVDLNIIIIQHRLYHKPICNMSYFKKWIWMSHMTLHWALRT